MATTAQTHQNALDYHLLSDDDPGHLVLNRIDTFGEFGDCGVGIHSIDREHTAVSGLTVTGRLSTSPPAPLPIRFAGEGREWRVSLVSLPRLTRTVTVSLPSPAKRI